MRRRVVAAILANTSDVLLPWAGTTKLRAIAQEVGASSCERVAVVLGTSAAGVSNALTGLPVITLPNVLWSEGVAAAIRCAVAWALRSGADGLLLVHGDQARVDRAHVDSLLSAFRTARCPVASSVYGHLEVPAVFGIESFARLGSLAGDSDARLILRTEPIVQPVPWPDGSVEHAIDVAIESVLDDMTHVVDAAAPTAISDLATGPVVLGPYCAT
jgi:CTP:molybdopterin cytidylyltransferase MocA